MKNIPSSIYRLQLSEHFTLKKALDLLDYLYELGVEGVYCSPYFAATSAHGYDIIDPNRINPLIATAKEYQQFCKKLKKLNLYHMADIVPNHMGIKGDNRWWQDVLKRGKKSKYASFFDVDWAKEKILLPILNESIDQAIKKNHLKITNKEQVSWIQYHDQFFPISKASLKKNCNLKTLLELQYYRLVPWQRASQEMGYRRFFNINELIGLRIEDQTVLEMHHKWIFELLKKKKIDGLRIDHPDGLYDPQKYFNALRKKHKGLIVVEKILGWEEELPSTWKVDGTVGYEFLNILTGVFVKKDEALTRAYERFIGKHFNFDDLIYEKKKFYTKTEMSGEVKSLSEKLYLFSSKTKEYAELSQETLNRALFELLACFPVYRSYIRLKGGVPSRDLPYLQKAFITMRARNRDLSPLAFDLLEKIFFLKMDTPYLRDFILRFQQLSAPVMAKGFEDIALYNYNRLLALNEVGSSPNRHGITKEEFHLFCQNKKKKWPCGLLASSTHDTKRSHDVRMQLAVLSEIPDQWERMLQTWNKLNRRHKTLEGQELFPDLNAEYFLYQILLGVWPSRPTFERLWPSFQKSIREAREFTSWNEKNIAYEKACERFLKTILQPNSPFLKSFEQFQQEIEEFGKWNILSSTALQLGAPGIVDIYEGCENWRYTLVDPDNRTAPNFSSPQSEKSSLYQVALNFRKKHKELFLKGEYLPLEVVGQRQDHVIAYLRTYRKQACLIASLRFFTSVKTLDQTEILLPKKMGRGVEIFNQEQYEGASIQANQLFEQAPFAWIFWE